jgi:hypothetical protein
MFINCLWFIEQAWETVFKPFTMKISQVIRIFTNYLWKTGSWKRDASFFAEFSHRVQKRTFRKGTNVNFWGITTVTKLFVHLNRHKLSSSLNQVPQVYTPLRHPTSDTNVANSGGSPTWDSNLGPATSQHFTHYAKRSVLGKVCKILITAIYCHMLAFRTLIKKTINHLNWYNTSIQDWPPQKITESHTPH